LRRIPKRAASGSEHPLNTGVHFFFLDEFAARYLVETHLNLLFEPLVMGEEPGDGLLHQIVRASSGRDGKLLELRFLIWRQMYFHSDIPRIPRAAAADVSPSANISDKKCFRTGKLNRKSGEHETSGQATGQRFRLGFNCLKL
jgi:hypothetical protein